MGQLLRQFVTLLAVFTLIVGYSQKKGVGTEPCYEMESVSKVEIEGVIAKIGTEDCLIQADKSLTYLVIRSGDMDMNVHLGPTENVIYEVNSLLGSKVKMHAVRSETTKRIVALYMEVDGKTIEFRDDNLIPVWFRKKDRQSLIQ